MSSRGLDGIQMSDNQGSTGRIEKPTVKDFFFLAVDTQWRTVGVVCNKGSLNIGRTII
jgi:hypothetical protein